jgi:hypothetical protein
LPKNFLEYGPKHLPKVNAQRLANSLVQIRTVPVLDEGQVLYSSPESANNEPRSCANCWMWNEHPGTCYIMGPDVRAEKFTYPPKEELGAKPIEYWPVCGMWDYGKHNEGRPVYKAAPYDDPDAIGFGFVNAPEVGLERSGTNCGGQNGGDDCDNYITKGSDKRAENEAFCRVLQKNVPNNACCSAWCDDDWVDWNKGQDLLKELDERKQRASSPNPLVGRIK